MKKRILSLALAGALCLSLSAPALAAGLDNFGKVNVYTVGQFTDVPADAWFAPNVQAAYELDLMTGSSATTFNPNGNLTIAESRHRLRRGLRQLHRHRHPGPVRRHPGRRPP